MRKTKLAFLTIILFGLGLAFVPAATSQAGTYTFHGAVGDQKILKVTTVDDSGLNNLFGANWTKVIGIFGGQAYDVGAQSKSVVTAVNFNTKYAGLYAVTNYTTNNWVFTTGAFNSTPDIANYTVTSFYNPKNLTSLVQSLYSKYGFNVSVNDAALWMTQLPTPVNQYLQDITWQTGWSAVNNTIVYNATANEFVNPFAPSLIGYTFRQNCTETWIFDSTFGSWIGFRIQNSTGGTIYEFSVEISGISGFNVPAFIGFTLIGIITVGYIVRRRIQKKF